MLLNKKIFVLSGHFGSGKTEIAINMAILLRKNYGRVAVNDLDIINPYFRSRNVSDIFKQHDIELISPKGRFATALNP